MTNEQNKKIEQIAESIAIDIDGKTFTSHKDFREFIKGRIKRELSKAIQEAKQEGREEERAEKEKWLNFFRDDIETGFKPICKSCGRMATKQTVKGKSAQRNNSRPVNWGYYCKKCYDEGLKIEEEAMFGDEKIE